MKYREGMDAKPDWEQPRNPKTSLGELGVYGAIPILVSPGVPLVKYQGKDGTLKAQRTPKTSSGVIGYGAILNPVSPGGVCRLSAPR